MNLDSYITNLFSDPQMLRMGHGQEKDNLNLGLGWLYYALGRMLQPQKAVVIGSWRGFTPSVIAKALLDNQNQSDVTFIDPSLADNFWSSPEDVKRHFDSLGTPNIKHFKHTTQSFVETDDYRLLDDIGLVMIDGYHTAEQARFDYLSFLPKLSKDAVCLFHDSVRIRESQFYGEGKSYQHSVRLLIERLEQTAGLEVLTFPIGSGLTMITGKPDTLELIEKPFHAE